MVSAPRVDRRAHDPGGFDAAERSHRRHGVPAIRPRLPVQPARAAAHEPQPAGRRPQEVQPHAENAKPGPGRLAARLTVFRLRSPQSATAIERLLSVPVAERNGTWSAQALAALGDTE